MSIIDLLEGFTSNNNKMIWRANSFAPWLKGSVDWVTMLEKL